MKQQFSLSDLWMPIMMRFLDVEHTEGAESNAGILELGQRNNENDIDEEEDSYADMSGLIEREEDSAVLNNENTLLEYSTKMLQVQQEGVNGKELYKHQ